MKSFSKKTTIVVSLIVANLKQLHSAWTLLY